MPAQLVDFDLSKLGFRRSEQ